MLKNKKLEERRKKIPLDVKILMDKTFAIVEQIDIVLKKQNKTQKDLADLLGKRESEISKWMRGTHNFTQKTIAKIEAVLGETITMCPKDVKQPEYNILVFSPTHYVKVKNSNAESGSLNTTEEKKLSLFVHSGEEVFSEECYTQMN